MSLTGWESFENRLSGGVKNYRVRREKCELCVLSWNVQGASGGLGMLVQQISEVEEWDAILLQELSFNDEFLSLEELEASLGGSQIGDEC